MKTNKIEQLDSGAKSYFNEMGRTPIMSREEESEVARQYKETGCDRYRKRLVEANLRFVVKVALDYVKYGFPLDDLIQEGNVGLLKAVEKFDPDRQLRLITYAVWWIRTSIHEYILRNWSLVKIGTTQGQRRIFIALMKGGDFEVPELAEDENVGLVEARETVARIKERDLSLVVSSGDVDEGTDIFHDNSVNLVSAEDEVAAEELRQYFIGTVRLVVDQLIDGDRDQRLADSRMLSEPGSDDFRTLNALGEEWGVCRERVRQLDERFRKRIVASLPDDIAEYFV